MFHVEQLRTHLYSSYEKQCLHYPGANLPSLTEAQVASLLQFMSLLEEWTSKVDLVAPATSRELLDRHLLDSLAAWLEILFHVEHPAGPILDVGSGGGLPGVVFSILAPDRQVICCEPRGKRCDFLREVRRRLKLNMTVEQQRVEELDLEPLGRPTLAVSRALGLDETFVKEASRLLRPGGRAVILVGPSHNCGSDIQHGEFVGYYDYPLVETSSSRRLAVWRYL